MTTWLGSSGSPLKTVLARRRDALYRRSALQGALAGRGEVGLLMLGREDSRNLPFRIPPGGLLRAPLGIIFISFTVEKGLEPVGGTGLEAFRLFFPSLYLI